MDEDDSGFVGEDGSGGWWRTCCDPTRTYCEYAMLKDGKKRYVVRIANDSGEGLSVQYSGDAVFQESQSLQLHMKRGHCEVEVVWIIGGGTDTLLGLQPKSPMRTTPTGERSFSIVALCGLVACGLLLATNHFVGFDASWSRDVSSFVGKLRQLLLP